MKTIKHILIILVMISMALTPVFGKIADSYFFAGKPAHGNLKNGEPIHELATHTFMKPFQFSAPLSRPIRAFHFTSPSGHFIIHYDNDSFNAVPQNYTYNDSIPDFVYKAAEYLDESYLTLRDTLSYIPPPTDNINSPEIDIYFRYDRTYYGVTQPEENDGNGAYTSYLMLSTQLEDSTIFYTYGLEGLSVTCAHELFHMFQLGYVFRNQDIFYFEMSSVWFEEYMYPEVNDYHSYFNEYAENWKYAINSSTLDYNNVGFNLYIDKRFSQPGQNIIKRIWDRILDDNALNSIRNELEYQGITFEEALRDWGTAQVLCGPYSANNFAYPFNDAEEMNTISFDNYALNTTNSLEMDIGITANPSVSYFKISDLPDQILLFDMILSEGTDAQLICLNGNYSEVRNLNTLPLVIDGTYFNNCILSIGLDEENATGSLAFSALAADKLASLYPNPLNPEQVLNLSYVLVDANQQGILAIYDLFGRKVYSRNLNSTELFAGLHYLSLVPKDLGSGVYIIALHTDEGVLAEKFTFIK